MAKPAGVIRYSGTIGGVSQYKSKHGWIMRKKGGPDADQMKKSAAFERVRENGKEFGACGKAAGWVRKALFPVLRYSSDFRMVSRLTKVFLAIKKLDGTSKRGKRNVATGMVAVGAKALLNGFEFNGEAPVQGLLKKEYTLNKVTGAIQLKKFVPKQDVNAPKGATHLRLKAIWLKINLSDGIAASKESVTLNLPLNASMLNVTLQPQGVPGGNGFSFYLLQVRFYQEQNGKNYSLKNGKYNGMRLIEVD